MTRPAIALLNDASPADDPIAGALWGQLCFDGFTLTPDERLLIKNGLAVEIGGRSFDLLLALIEQRGRMVPKRALLQRVWPDAIVEESALRFHMTRLRRILNDGRDGVRLIATQVGVGYAFVGVVRWMRPGTSPAQHAAARPPVTLPDRLDRMIGRQRDVDALIERIATGRLLTIVGPAGVGKTSLAVEIAHDLQSRFGDGARFVDLAGVDAPDRLPMAIAQALRAETDADRPTEALIDHLRVRRQLLVLDNCEHLVHAVADLVEQIASTAPHVKVLITSRQALRARNEQVHRLAPHNVPVDVATGDRGALLACSAVELFLHHFMTAGGVVGEDLDRLRTVARICVRLDGVALAIELAAVRAATHGIDATAETLGGELSLLWPGRRTASPRQRTLKAMLDWSYVLLSENERRVFELLSTLPTPFSLETALGTVAGETLDMDSVVTALDELAEKSLIRPHDGEYHWIEFSRVYARGRLSMRASIQEQRAQSPAFRVAL